MLPPLNSVKLYLNVVAKKKLLYLLNITSVDITTGPPGSTVGFLLLQCSSGVVLHPGDLRVSVPTRSCRVLIFASSSYLSVIYLFSCGDPLMS